MYPLWSQQHEGQFLNPIRCCYHVCRWMRAVTEGVLPTPRLLQVHSYVNEN